MLSFSTSVENKFEVSGPFEALRCCNFHLVPKDEHEFGGVKLN